MAVLFATLGFTPQAVIPSLNWVPDLEKVMVFYSVAKRSHDAMEEVQKACQAREVEFGSYEVKDVHALLPTMEELSRFVDEHKPNDIIFNITGGTKMLSAAALFLCVLRGIRVIYVREEDRSVVEVPVLRVDYSALLTDKEIEVLNNIIKLWNSEKAEYEKNKKERRAKEEEEFSIPLGLVYKEIGGGKSVASGYLERLEKKGLIEKFEDEENGRRKRLRLKEGAIFYSYQKA